MSKISKQPKSEIRPSLIISKVTENGEGSAVKFTLYPANGETDGHVEVEIADMVDGARFDWDNAGKARLYFGDVCNIIQVLRGKSYPLDGTRITASCSSDGATEVIVNRRKEPTSGYWLEIVEEYGCIDCEHLCSCKDCEREKYSSIFLDDTYACGLCEALAGAMHRIAFGD